MGGEGAWDHINSCIHHNANWTRAHEHVLRALERICNAAGFATNHKRVLTSEGSRRADLEVRNIRVAQKTDLLIDVTIRQPFIGAGRSGHNQGQLRNPDNPDHILESAAADKIRNYRDPYQRNRQVAFSCRHTCLSRDASMTSSCVCFSSSPTSRQTTTLRSLDIRRTKRSFASVAVSSFTATGAPLGWHVLKLWRCVAPPPPRDAMLLSLPGNVAKLIRRKRISLKRDNHPPKKTIKAFRLYRAPLYASFQKHGGKI
jgi:hypothetical protein